MVSKTLDEGLRRYGVGGKVRALRLRKGMGLVELGKHTRLSAAMLSKLERGKMFPTLPTLLRIALVFSVGLEHFFLPERKKVIAVVRRGERQRFPDRPGGRDVAYYFESLDFAATERKLSAYYAEFETVAAEKVRMHSHRGAELIYVLRGELAVKFAGEEFVLGENDSMYFDSSQPHGYRRAGAKATAAMVVTAVGEAGGA